MNITPLIRPSIRDLVPYASARGTASHGILLDANENAFGSAGAPDGKQLNRYPDPFQRELRTKLAETEGVEPVSVFAGVGSDEIIDLLIRIFCVPGSDRVMVAEPTYGMYRVAAAVNDVPTDDVRLDGSFQLDVTHLISALRRNTKLVFLCSPNNPTGNRLRRNDVLRLCSEIRSVVVVDEAYVDFSSGPSLAGDVATTPNLVVLKTLSKSWGLAGIRLGYCIANPQVVGYLDKIKAPYNINALTSAAAMRALSDTRTRAELVRRSVSERGRLASALASFRFVERVFPSEANFVLLRCHDHTAVLKHLAARQIIIRDRSSQPGLEGCVRITVGTPKQNDALLNAFKELDGSIA